MLLSRALTLSVLVCAVPSRHDEVRLAYEPAVDSTVHKRFTFGVTAEVDRATWNGRELRESLFGSLGGAALEVGSVLAVTDEICCVGDGHPREIARTFDDLRTVWQWSDRRDVLHPLLYRTVRFDWDPDDRRYDASWEGRRTERSFLDRLYEDLDLRRLLPAECGLGRGPFAVGARWSIPLSRLAPVVLPGGDVHRDPDLWIASGMSSASDRFGGRLKAWLAGNGLDEYLEAELDEIFEEERPDGIHVLAAIRCEIDWRSWRDLSGTVEQWLGMSLEQVEMDLDADGSGWVVWEVTAGHFDTFEFDLELDYRFDVSLGRSGRAVLAGTALGTWSALAVADRVRWREPRDSDQGR